MAMTAMNMVNGGGPIQLRSANNSTIVGSCDVELNNNHVKVSNGTITKENSTISNGGVLFHGMPIPASEVSLPNVFLFSDGVSTRSGKINSYGQLVLNDASTMVAGTYQWTFSFEYDI